jgi:small-conductance mechanosensitive channel
MEVMRSTASAHPQVLDKPPPLAEITATTDGRATVSLRAWTGRESYGPLRSELFVRIRAALTEAGFKPAYPRQRHAE